MEWMKLLVVCIINETLVAELKLLCKNSYYQSGFELMIALPLRSTWILLTGHYFLLNFFK